ncbi:hypothetical protein J8281_11655 [Aquimarina sp. U1-2]|uniref:hypothetical protein n=1 Tax=Aquimarina sp. U1-2 TaxID=2823141 RepID=UPI001AEC8A35|nr:hypothetical protein [Aquimarina sp. U1-2]MBP2832842.1 hypothetical protein [Aquimarina sp. U1-2]
MIEFNIKIIVAIVICSFHLGYAQNEKNNCKNDILAYLDSMERMLSPKENQVYYMKYSTKTDFHDSQNIPSSATTSEMLLSENKILLDDENMKIFGDNTDVFVVLPKIGKIYWNNSDPRLFLESNSQKKFLEIERTLLSTAIQINCSTKKETQYISIVPSEGFKTKSGLKRQVLKYNLASKQIISVENLFTDKSKIKKQVVLYEVIDYKSNKRVKKPLEYIFDRTALKVAYKNFEIIDNRKIK